MFIIAKMMIYVLPLRLKTTPILFRDNITYHGLVTTNTVIRVTIITHSSTQVVMITIRLPLSLCSDALSFEKIKITIFI